MKINFGLKTQVIFNILLLGIFGSLSAYYLFLQVKERDDLLQTVTENFQPSISRLTQMNDKFEEAIKVSRFWAVSSFDNLDIFQAEFNNLYQFVIPEIRLDLIDKSKQWDPDEQAILNRTLRLISDSLYYSFLDYIEIANEFKSDGELSFDLAESLMEGNDLFFLINEIDQNLDYLIEKRRNQVKEIFGEISQRTADLKRIILILGILFTILIIGFTLITFRQLSNNIGVVSHSLIELSKGKIPQPVNVKEKTEFSDVLKNLNQLFAYLRNLTIVSKKINEKDFTSEFTPLSREDELGNALMNLQRNLKQASDEEEKRKREDEERTWFSEGVARINDILRFSNDQIDELTSNVIREIVHYTGSKVGGLFIINNDNPADIHAKLVAAYAFDRKKFASKMIRMGEGLVGRCMLENETIYLTDVPDNYLSIKSGLGDDNPKSILIVPIHLNENVYGVIELASFREFENFKIKFVETIGMNVATSISKLEDTLQTSRLLEQSKKQALEMAAQEEEMRLNMQKIKATQEESAKREQKLLKKITTLKSRLDRSQDKQT